MVPPEMSLKIDPFILSGGAGTRLWPLSRHSFPKQFHSLNDEFSLLQQTAMRLENADFHPPKIICNQQHRFLAAEQMQQTGFTDYQVILEPVGRNTAAAAAIAALHTASFSNDQPHQERLILLLPADHYIEKSDKLLEAIVNGVDAAMAGNIVTFGVKPATPEPGYGYIETTAKPDDATSLKVKRFIEKPDTNTAEDFISQNNYYWNAGIFLFTFSTIRKAFNEHAPEIWQCCEAAINAAEKDLDFLRLGESAFSACPDISFDYAILEKAKNITCTPLKTAWSDLGKWTSLWQAGEKDQLGNVIKGDVTISKTKNSLAHATDGNSLSLIGLSNVIAVATSDAVLVAAKDSIDDLKQILTAFEKQGRSVLHEHKRVFRPWGASEIIGEGQHYQVKRLLVNPGASLSLQKHHKRAEHWVVVKGTATVQRGSENFTLHENQSTYIPIGELHRLENEQQSVLEIIEVQSGVYLGEDDIERLEDNYGRLGK